MTDLHCHSISHQLETMTLIECGIAILFGHYVDIEIRVIMLLCQLYQSGGNTLMLISLQLQPYNSTISPSSGI